MRALTIRQPYAWAIAHGGKTIENRAWVSDHRGLIAIHAATGVDSRSLLDLAVDNVARLAETPQQVVRAGIETRGAVVAVARLTEVCSAARYHAFSADLPCCGRWAIGGHRHFRLAEVRALADPVPVKGRLNLWHLPGAVKAAVNAQLGQAAHA